MNEDFNPQVYELNKNDYEGFIRNLKEKDNPEIEHIITRYKSYKPEMAEAALYVAVDRGIITYGLKEKITEQIRLNFSEKSKYAKQAIWEKQNAFKEYVSVYSDDQLYEIIDNPADIVLDVFHAVLQTALERELISSDDFNNLFTGGVLSARTESELEQDRLNELYSDPFEEEPELTDEQIEAYKAKYWKCPSCHELVEKDFDICWNCQAVKPEIIEQPQSQDIIKELKPVSSFNPFRSGFLLIAAGIGVFTMSFFRHYSRTIPWDERYLTLAFSGLFVILGFGIIILGITGKPDKT
jgi:hypothetical protein